MRKKGEEKKERKTRGKREGKKRRGKKGEEKRRGEKGRNIPQPFWLKRYLVSSEQCGSFTHVFHSSFLGSCSLCLHFLAFYRSLSLDLMSHSCFVDASDRPVPKSLVQFTSSSFGSPNSCGSDLHGMGTRHGVTVDEKLDALLSQFA